MVLIELTSLHLHKAKEYISPGTIHIIKQYIYKVLHVCNRWSSPTMSPAATHLVKLNQQITNTLNFLCTIEVLYVLPMLTLTLLSYFYTSDQQKVNCTLHREPPLECSFISSRGSKGGSSKFTTCTAASNADDTLTASLQPF